MSHPQQTPSSSTTATIRRRPTTSRRNRSGLLSHAYNATSQNGEDGIIARIFDLLPFQPVRSCVDVGAWDGRHLSNTFSLLNHHDCSDDNDGEVTRWKGVLIEADCDKFAQLKDLYSNHTASHSVVCVNATVSCADGSPNSLRSILNQLSSSSSFQLSREFDFLCIDVDGSDYWLLADILSNDNHDNQPHFHPKVICIEFNPSMPTDLIYIQPRCDDVRHGSSLSALVELATDHDYVLIETTVFNAFFIQKSLYEEYFQQVVPDTSIEALYELTMGTSIYQLYDGTMKLWGCKRMLWHVDRVPMNEERIQMLSREERMRGFPFAPKVVNENGNNDDHGENELIEESAINMSPYCCTQQQFNGSDNDSNTTNNSNTHQAKQECFTKLNQSLQKDGFALVKGTAIPSTLCLKALQAAKSFLHEADEDVRRSCLTTDRARRGYSPICTENFASLIGMRGPNDLVKKFRVGPETTTIDEENDNNLTKRQDEVHDTKTTSSLHQPNAWPDQQVWDKSLEFKSIIEEYYNQLRIASNCILRAICDGVIHENSTLEQTMRVVSSANENNGDDDNQTTMETSILTLLGYQPGSRHKKGSKGYLNPLVAAHTDVGMITVLLFDGGTCASLQRSNVGRESSGMKDNNEWVDVNLPSTNYLEKGHDPIFVVNVGDCLSELTGGYLRSTLHRVVPRPLTSSLQDKRDAVRTSLALFVGLEPLAQICLPSGEEMSYEEWRKRRIARALDVIKK